MHGQQNVKKKPEQIIPVERHYSTTAGEQLKVLVLLSTLSLTIAYIVKGLGKWNGQL